MLKHLAILVIFFAVAVLLNAGQEQKGSNQTNGERNSDRTPIASCICNQTCAPDTKTAKAEPPHWYTSPEWWLCILGFATLIFIAVEASAARLAANVAKNNLMLIQRPVLSIVVATVNGLGSYEVSGQLRVTNTGARKAFLKRHCSELIVAERLPALSPCDGKIGEPFVKTEIPPAGHGAVVFPSTPRRLTDAEYPAVANGVEFGKSGKLEPDSKQLYLVGWISYFDEPMGTRTRGLCWKLNYLTRAFEPVKDDNYDYDRQA